MTLPVNNKRCDHFAVRIHHIQPICRVEALHLLVRSLACIYFVGLGEPPIEQKLAILKGFRNYCPKCGAKIDYEAVKKRLVEKIDVRIPVVEQRAGQGGLWE